MDIFTRLDEIEKLIFGVRDEVRRLQPVSNTVNLHEQLELSDKMNSIYDSIHSTQMMALDQDVHLKRNVEALAAFMHLNRALIVSMGAAIQHIGRELDINLTNVPLGDDDKDELAKSMKAFSFFAQQAVSGASAQGRDDGEKILHSIFNGVPHPDDEAAANDAPADDEDGDVNGEMAYMPEPDAVFASVLSDAEIDTDNITVGFDVGDTDYTSVSFAHAPVEDGCNTTGPEKIEEVEVDLDEILKEAFANMLAQAGEGELDGEVRLARIQMITDFDTEEEITREAVRMVMEQHDAGMLNERDMMQLIAVMTNDQELMTALAPLDLPPPGRVTAQIREQMDPEQPDKQFTVYIRDDNDLKETLMGIYSGSLLMAGLVPSPEDLMQMLKDIFNAPDEDE